MKDYFKSNETLECCKVSVTQQGDITIDPKTYNTFALERLGTPKRAIRGRFKVADGVFNFAPYAEQSRKPTYQKQVVVGSTTLATTDDKVKISFMVPRHLTKPLMILYIQSEIDEVKRRLETDVYDSLVKGTQQQETHPNPPCEGGDSESIAEKE